ncbi:type I restriction enzyme HsdR N-terminal domain-containing protein [soil metagenome]
MIKITYPERKPSIKGKEGKDLVFCIIRKRWVILTPEEWVRQNFLLYLTEMLSYPASLIAVEKQLMLSDVKKRFDIVVYDKESTMPFMLVECKEMNVPLSENVLHQVLRYNSSVQAPWILITNGSFCIAYKKKTDRFEIAEQLPSFI